MANIKVVKSGIAAGENRGHIVTPRYTRPRNKVTLGKRAKFIRDLLREVTGFAPYERRIMELLKNNKEKRARKLAKKRLGTMRRAKSKLDELGKVLSESRRAGMQ